MQHLFSKIKEELVFLTDNYVVFSLLSVPGSRAPLELEVVPGSRGSHTARLGKWVPSQLPF